MRRYAVVIEPGKHGYGAWVPDLPGCVSVGDTLPELRRMIREAMEFHMEGIREDGDAVPLPTASCAVVDMGRRYAGLVERTDRGFTARAPDFEGCVAAAKTRREALLLLRDALRRHVEILRGEGKRAPVPALLCEWVEVRPFPPRRRTTRTLRGGGHMPRTGGGAVPTTPRRPSRRPASRRRGGMPIPA